MSSPISTQSPQVASPIQKKSLSKVAQKRLDEQRERRAAKLQEAMALVDKIDEMEQEIKDKKALIQAEFEKRQEEIKAEFALKLKQIEEEREEALVANSNKRSNDDYDLNLIRHRINDARYVSVVTNFKEEQSINERIYEALHAALPSRHLEVKGKYINVLQPWTYKPAFRVDKTTGNAYRPSGTVVIFNVIDPACVPTEWHWN